MKLLLRRTLPALVCVTLVTAGCGGTTSDDQPDRAADEASQADDQDEQDEQEEATPSVPSGSEPVPGAEQPGTRQAVGDLAERLGVAAADVTVVSVEEVTWRDGSLGCAEPGMMYSQALVPGTRIVLEADGARHEYHAGGARDAFWCEAPTE